MCKFSLFHIDEFVKTFLCKFHARVNETQCSLERKLLDKLCYIYIIMCIYYHRIHLFVEKKSNFFMQPCNLHDFYPDEIMQHSIKLRYTKKVTSPYSTVGSNLMKI